MKFADTGEKLRSLRKQLSIKQEELDVVGVSRNFISMIENGKRKLPQHIAFKLMNIFRDKARTLGIKLDVDEQWLMTSAQKQAIEYCNEKLNGELSSEDINIITNLVKNYKIEELIFKVYMLKGNKLYDERLYEEAFTYYYEMLDHIKNQSKEKAFIYNKLGKCKIMMLNYIEAISYLNKCYEYCIINNDSDTKRNCLYNMALSYFKLGLYDLALNNMHNFIKLCNMPEDFKEYIWAVLLESNCYIESKKYHLAINILTDVVNKFIDPEDLLLGYVYNSLGVLYIDLNKLDKALLYIEKAEFIRQLKDEYNLSHTILNKAKIFMKQKMTHKALDLINKAIVLAEECNDYECIIDSYELLENLYLQDKRSNELLNLYLKMIPILKKISKKEQYLEVYIKLLSMAADNEDINSIKYYLNEIEKM